MAGPGLVEGRDPDAVHLSAAHWPQGAGAGCGVTGEVLVTRRMVSDGSVDPLVQFPGHGESGHTVTHHHRHIGTRW